MVAVGRSLAPLARDEHYDWQNYQPWDNQHKMRRDADIAERQVAFEQQRATQVTEKEDRRDAFLRRRAEYEEWCPHFS